MNLFKKVGTVHENGLKVFYYIFPLWGAGEFYIIHHVKQKMRVFKWFDVYVTVKFTMFLLELDLLDFVIEPKPECTPSDYRKEVIDVFNKYLDSTTEELDSRIQNGSDAELAHVLKSSVKRRMDAKLLNFKDLDHEEQIDLSSFLTAGYEFLHASRGNTVTRYTLTRVFEDVTWLMSVDIVRSTKGKHLTNIHQIVVPHDIAKNIEKTLKEELKHD